MELLDPSRRIQLLIPFEDLGTSRLSTAQLAVVLGEPPAILAEELELMKERFPGLRRVKGVGLNAVWEVVVGESFPRVSGVPCAHCPSMNAMMLPVGPDLCVTCFNNLLQEGV
jgi:hypothetical protein